ncbi:MAG: LytTR family DNA-binding domain-containing protein [Lachnospiraceae bacterium]|nr:LytTR family DNA-binding domain-containing protein [Lachnospiraceae bacterium]
MRTGMLSIAVCDDEIRECCTISGKIREILEEMGQPCMVRQFFSGQELLQDAAQFDLIFLDIMMRPPDGMKTAQMLREKENDTLLIFVSFSRSYVFDAYDVEAFQYLLKPIDEKKLKGVLQRAVDKIQRRSQEFIIVSKERKNRKLFLDDIYYFEIWGRTIVVHGTEGLFTYYGQIGVLEKTLQEKGFFRCHKSFLINLKYADVYNRQEVLLANGEKIMIARRRYEEFGKAILAYMRKSGGIGSEK